jgi:carboxyl-terminal processing protease
MEVLSPLGARTVPLRRRALFLASVSYFMKTESVGYLQVAAFQDTTVAEVDTALAALSQAGMKSLIVDLRGNSGGLFEAAIEVARRLLTSGTIASTRHHDPKHDAVYQARNPAALTVPAIVLIDADTASAAEVLAGALKENMRARLLGQATFGKGCTQCVLKLPSAAGGVPTGGLRLTVARFYSPRGEPYSGRGVTPDLFIERSLSGDFDAPLHAAIVELERHLRTPR